MLCFSHEEKQKRVVSFFWFCGIVAIMRFPRGSNVEVFSKRDMPLGCWRPAEIIFGNGHTYTVKFDRHSDNEPVLGWVSCNAIRPRPPVEITNWLSGDIAEVLHNFAWKLATILKGLGNKQVLVTLHGSLEDLTVDLDCIRVRQSWEDNKWIIMGKRSVNNKEARRHDILTGSTHRLKRSSLNWLTECESSVAVVKKYRQVDNCGQIYRVLENHVPHGQYVHTLPSHCKMESKKRGRPSLIIKFSAISQRSASNQRFDVSNDEDIDLCSVGSCSSSDSWEQINYGLADDSNGDHSDAESSNASSHDTKNVIHKSQEEAAMARIHEFELHAYRSTLRALHASGPISWEQQSLISNLRLSLNISNDQHLMELKNLLSYDH